jgi:NAD(P)-dependent dehydrogenase (short-subunit alcohol dehydrogenase family)
VEPHHNGGLHLGYHRRAWRYPVLGLERRPHWLTRALADEVGDDGVFVTAIAPGTVDTPQLAADAAFAGVSLAEIKQRYADDTLVKRIATADEIAGLIAWLAADRTGAFSGETVAVTGGRSE